MEFIYSKIEGFVLQLPPLLQLILGAAVVVLILRTMVAIGDFFEKKGEKKKSD
ncbi:MAG: hypothetical protein ACQ9MH_02250 [Nitrospinales bacterium]|jgi:hypothetical protein